MRTRTLVATNTLAQIVGKFITAGVTFITTILIARYYGVSGYGEFTKITAFIALFYLVSDFGFNAIVLRLISEQPKKENYFFQNLLALRIVFSLFVTGLAVFVAFFLPFNPVTFTGFTPLSKMGIFIMSFTILTQAIYTTANLIFQKNLRYDKSIIASSIGSIAGLLILLILLFYRTSLLLSLFSFVFGGILMAIVSLYLIEALRKLKFETKIDFALWKKIFKETLPLGLTLVFNLIYFRVDTFILTYFRSTFEVGIYGLAYKFFEFPLTIPTFFMNSLYPLLLVESRIKNQESRIIKKSFHFLLFASLIFVSLCLFLSPLLTLIKPEFSSSVLPFKILSLSLPFFFLSSLFMWILISRGKQKLLMIIYSFTMILNIILNLIFIPTHGYIAAAIITGVSEAVVMLFTGVASFRLLNQNLSWIGNLKIKN
ncbi:MAG: Polysaccharide biosynthesis protein, membrane-associated [Candidatus Gottesmanbacteria bacterium GW2011_GWC2_39_8]|uniref:Polysaccharide biosynthesis protein, membrane-associated n=1 Tax=Candidatus Gottesmanbacteria bacterium GW2011_GWC2_39_8 TaxID=1618450 RepID=A0A0G0Q9W4_9BACT|nr:MAG: Polysaccharide biosynthesis protein, membrane-associated [Candidatus Gottesmanbacteria bacterium GW2011_GWC2_39_8]